ncbi:MAG: class I SAM-dependent methyltransferase [Candidatus Eremiobacteraeota bacterium]|nr:class I SAM-dependent methyltransferase [Candidatus Eremiobacteraeota bacterium]MCW5870451.1 class I SAM-dependent methyltransferase [Candidatus Eremiobacteraeota bacterium]
MKDLQARFQAMLQKIPVSLAVRECNRLVALQARLPATATVLDVGCGDGSFWKVFPGVERLTVDGIDLNSHEIALARATGVYRSLQVSDVSLSVPQGCYEFVIGNCSMEHIPDIHRALTNLRHVMNDESRMLLFVPAFGWPKVLSTVRFLQRLSPRLGMAAAGALDGFFQHHHIYDEVSWKLLVENAGYRVEKVQCLGAPEINREFERNLGAAFVEFILKVGLRRYAPLRSLRRLPDNRFFEALSRQPVPLGSPDIVEYVIEASLA